jgi:hypothetical protein
MEESFYLGRNHQQMNDDVLDTILRSLHEDYNRNYVNENDFYKRHQQLFPSKREWAKVRAFLIRERYIRWNATQTKIQITPEGDRFLNKGGYSARSEYSERTLKVATQSRNWAIIGISVTILLFLIPLLCSRSQQESEKQAPTPAKEIIKHDTVIVKNTSNQHSI